MPRIGIIACQILEKELALLLNENKKIKKIFLRRNPENRKFSNYLLNKPKMYNDVSFLSPKTRENEIIIEILPAALHTDISKLEEICDNTVTCLKERCDVILLFYGLCGNALSSVISRDDVDIITLSDDGVVDDCFVALMGRYQYMKQLRRGGSFFLSNGWIEHWKEIKTMLAGGNKGIKMLFSINNYNRFLHIKSPGCAEEDCLTEECMCMSNQFNVDYERIDGTLNILKDGLDKAYEKVNKHQEKSINYEK